MTSFRATLRTARWHRAVMREALSSIITQSEAP